mmetsp:Transcript_2130/g.4954  ORF Transcript_2130/g.4954 Transcript_2130/m.4954 type:complete len:263 (+) Transcript_2130:114-902(+)|eukprot:CAMPEP_0178997176 /NCGR_PEP_ID=MMETSP0795-20121207/8781_1 /TAXON_ID=88552 /ORGANISM="Amoebophrya sp., Strain Ameob2" /LENGTH=262 /DNA_ID=CAMNT_0020689653 /DNA_START=33 /DNA_END=821 /DNA_ORIENTATION=+
MASQSAREYYNLDTDRSSTIISARSDDLHLRLTRTHKPQFTVSDEEYFRPRRRSGNYSRHRESDKPRGRSGEHRHKRSHGHYNEDRNDVCRLASKSRAQSVDAAYAKHHRSSWGRTYFPRSTFLNNTDNHMLYRYPPHQPQFGRPAGHANGPSLVRSVSVGPRMQLVASPYDNVRAAGKESPMMSFPPRSFIFNAPRFQPGLPLHPRFHPMTPRTLYAQTLALSPNPANKLDHFTESTLVPERDVTTMNLRNVRGTGPRLFR